MNHLEELERARKLRREAIEAEHRAMRGALRERLSASGCTEIVVAIAWHNDETHIVDSGNDGNPNENDLEEALESIANWCNWEGSIWKWDLEEDSLIRGGDIYIPETEAVVEGDTFGYDLRWNY